MSSDDEPDDDFKGILYDNNHGEYDEVEEEVADIGVEEGEDIDDSNVGGNRSQAQRAGVVLVPSMDDDGNIMTVTLLDETSGLLMRGGGRGLVRRGRGLVRRGRGQGRRGRGQGRRGRGHGRRATDESGAQNSANRLVEIYVTDDDVPPSLRSEIVNIVQQREISRKKVKAKSANNEEPDAGNDALFQGDETALRFDWKPMDTFQGQREKFLPKKTGPTKPPKSAYEAFRQYWDDEILSYLATETNRSAATLAGYSAIFAEKWYETNVHELYMLFAFWMMLGIIRMPSLKSCFSLNPLLQTKVFRTMFAKTRYEYLCRALNFFDDSRNTRNLESSCLEHILDHLNCRFQSAYVPKQDICVGESLLQWKGQLPSGVKQCNIKNKPGIRIYELCESSSGYLWSFSVHAGKSARDDRFPSSLSESVKGVLKLIWPLFGKGYTVFMNDWFNSPLLARFLKKYRTDCVGTMKESCIDMPLLVKRCELKDSEFVARHSGDTVVMAYFKARRVCMISTYHGIKETEVQPSSSARRKLQVICDHTKNMGAVDRKNHMLDPYVMERKRGATWNLKLIKRLLNCSILNARILLQQSNKDNKDHLVFRLELVQQILDHHSKLVPRLLLQEEEKKAQMAKNDGLPQSRLTSNIHWPRVFITKIAGNRTSRRRCVWCSKRNRLQNIRTSYECESCEVALCLEPCFKLYHTLP